MMSRKEKKAEKLMNLAYEVARLQETRDPYEFRDALETGETVEEGIDRAAKEAFIELLAGNYETVIGWFYDPHDDCDYCNNEAERLAKKIRKACS